MNDFYRTVSAVASRARLPLVVGLLAFGLTGCYTQLKTVDPGYRTQAAETQERAQAEEPVYANEYRRAYRADGDEGYYGGSSDLYEYKYQYKYKYGAPYQYRARYGGWCDDAFFHDPWYYDSWCSPSYGSRFSMSFHFGSPYYHHRPWGRHYYSSWYGYGYRGGPYSNYYYGDQYYYYGDVDRDDDEEDYLSRRATIRGTTNAGQSAGRNGGGTTNASSERGIHSSSSGGRIGRTRGTSASERARTARARTDRSWAVERPTRTRDGRIGRSREATIDRSRDARTRSDDRIRTRRARPVDTPDPRVRNRSPRSNRGQSVGRSQTRDRSSSSTRTRTRSSSDDRSGSSSSGRSRDRGSDDGGSR